MIAQNADRAKHIQAISFLDHVVIGGAEYLKVMEPAIYPGATVKR